jgi:hypothetical protein
MGIFHAPNREAHNMQPSRVSFPVTLFPLPSRGQTGGCLPIACVVPRTAPRPSRRGTDRRLSDHATPHSRKLRPRLSVFGSEEYPLLPRATCECHRLGGILCCTLTSPISHKISRPRDARLRDYLCPSFGAPPSVTLRRQGCSTFATSISGFGHALLRGHVVGERLQSSYGDVWEWRPCRGAREWTHSGCDRVPCTRCI